MNYEQQVRQRYPNLTDAEVEIAVSVLKELDWDLSDYKSMTIAVNEATQGEVK